MTSDPIRANGDGQAKSTLKRWEFWFGLIGTICTLIMLWIAISEHLDKKEAQKKTEISSRAEQKATQDLQRTEHELQVVTATSLQGFVDHYSAHIDELKTAIYNYHSSVNDKSHERLQENQKELTLKARALVEFVVKWRTLLAPAEKMMDGKIEALSRSTEAGDLQATAASVETLIQNARSDLDAVRQAMARAQVK